jgi:hypothetical protein
MLRMPDPAEPFETWLLHCVAEAVENREVSADLLTELHAAIVEARRPLKRRIPSRSWTSPSG